MPRAHRRGGGSTKSKSSNNNSSSNSSNNNSSNNSNRNNNRAHSEGGTGGGDDPAGDVAIVCLPAFIIIGAQKSGSTAMLGYFLFHPDFAPARRKELHFFNRHPNDAKLASLTGLPAFPDINLTLAQLFSSERLKSYLDDFPALAALPPLAASAVRRPPRSRMSGEATPAYLLRPSTAALIRHLLPHVRLIAILRDPVDRALSEIDMKRRRVVAQYDDMTGALAKCYPGVPFAWSLTHGCRAFDAGLDEDRVAGAPPGDPEPTAAIFFTEGDGGAQCLRDAFRATQRAASRFDRVADLLADCLRASGPLLAPTLRAAQVLVPCVQEVLRPLELVLPLQEVLRREAEAVRECTAPGPDGALRVVWGTEPCWRHGLSANLAYGYVPRGLYAAQVETYLQHFPAEQLLVLADTELARAPNRTMNRVFAHVGLPPFDITRITEKDLYNACGAHFF